MDPTYQQAIKDIESSGGDYGALGPVTDSGDRAYGAYQVMGNNIPDWTEKHYGQRLTPDQFVDNKDAQDAVFNGEFGSYVKKYGNPQDAASMWFSGKPMAQAGNASDGGLTVPQYIQKFNDGLAKHGSGVSAINAAAGIQPAGAGPGALSLAEEADDDDDTKPAGALSTNSTIGKGALSTTRIMKGTDNDSKLDILSQGGMGIAASLAGISNPQQAYALNAQLAQMKKDNTSKYKVIGTKDGKIIRVDDSGNVDVVGGTPAGTTGPQMLGDPTKQADEYLKTLNPNDQAILNGWHEGTGIMPTAYSMKDPHMQQLQAAFQQAYPDADFAHLAGRQAFAKAYASKSAPSAIGGQITNSNGAVQNLNNLADNYLKLNNGDSALPSMLAHAKNATLNVTGDQGRNAIIQQLRGVGSDASGEITKVLTGGPGGTHERKERADRLANPEYGNSEAAGVMEAELNDLKGKHDQYIDYARSQMGQRWIDKHPEVEQNFKDQEAALRDKFSQLRGAGTDDKAKPAASLPKGVKSIQVMPSQ